MRCISHLNARAQGVGLSRVNSLDIMPVLLLLLIGLALSISVGIIVAVVRRARGKPRAPAKEPASPPDFSFERTCIFRRPACWLAVKSRNLAAVQSVLGLHNPKPCSWTEG